MRSTIRKLTALALTIVLYVPAQLIYKKRQK